MTGLGRLVEDPRPYPWRPAVEPLPLELLERVLAGLERLGTGGVPERVFAQLFG